jgi:type IV secretion system protein VirB10
MRVLIALALLCGVAASQDNSANPSLTTGSRSKTSEITIPSGTKVPVMLKNTISTKSNHVGDPIYAQSTFPVVVNDKIVVPAGTYVQGKISAIKPAGRVKGHAEVLIHFTTLIYPSGYTVMLPGSLENAPGVDKSKVKDKEGTIQGDSGRGERAAKIAVPAAEGGAAAGGLATGSRAGIAEGAGIGAAVGVAIAMFMRGNEVKMGPGTTLEVVLQRDVPVDGARIRTSSLAERE